MGSQVFDLVKLTFKILLFAYNKMEIQRFGCIYLITNTVNGKQYTGKTVSSTPHQRWRGHKSDARLHRYTNCHLSNAINLYGEDKFIIETLCVVQVHSLSNMEAYFAEQLGTYEWDSPGGYNMIECGGGGHIGVPRTAATKSKLSVSVRNSITPERRVLLSQQAKERFTPEQQQCMLTAVNNMSEEKKREAQAKRTAALNTPEARKQNSERTKALYDNPVYREKQAKLRKAQWTPARRERQRQVALAAHARNKMSKAKKGSKLTESQVRAIRASSGKTNTQLGTEFGVSRRTITDIISRKTWGWLKDENDGDSIELVD